MINLLLIAAVSFGVSYVALLRSGLFSADQPSTIDVLYSLPLLIDLFVITILAGIIFLRKRPGLQIKGWVGFGALVIFFLGLTLGYFTRFSGEVILTEGQTFYSGHAQFLPETVYRGPFASPPEFGMKLVSLKPSFSSDGKEIDTLSAETIFFQRENNEQVAHRITGGLPAYINGAFLRVKDLGYSPRYVLKTAEGRVLDSSFVFMSLFPPGSEGFFRLLSPLTYYMRYYPDGREDIAGPLLRVRVARNKDIVLNRDVRIAEDFAFENSRMSIDEVRMWTRLYVKKDNGEIVMMCGILLGAVFMVMSLRRKRSGD